MKLPGEMLRGTLDLTPIKDQIELLKRIIPDAKTVAITIQLRRGQFQISG